MEDPTPTPQPEVEPTSPEQEVRSLRAELEQKSGEIKAAHDKQLRAYAEMDNYKKRMARDQMEQLRYANEKLLKELLPVLDNLERALTHVKNSPERSPWAEGVELTFRQCLDVLKKFGVTPIPSIGEPFDPNRHQAVTYLDTHEHPEDHVAEELQKGYLYHERVLRPSMVAVARKPSRQATEESSEEPDDGGNQ
ncbi:MAG: nucleotide exchange factor GrpE [Nitrospirae bacterium]|nr:nucleotide exchange factor GrpE [Nitrospirota bacterium]